MDQHHPIVLALASNSHFSLGMIKLGFGSYTLCDLG